MDSVGELDDFQDAQDYFDPEIIDQLEKIRMSNLDEQNQVEEQDVVFKQRKKVSSDKKKQNLLVSIAMPKFKLQILEA